MEHTPANGKSDAFSRQARLSLSTVMTPRYYSTSPGPNSMLQDTLNSFEKHFTTDFLLPGNISTMKTISLAYLISEPTKQADFVFSF